MSIEKQEAAFDQRLAEMGIRIKDADNLRRVTMSSMRLPSWHCINSSTRNGSPRLADPSAPEKRPTSFWVTAEMRQSPSRSTGSSRQISPLWLVHHRNRPVLLCKKVQKGAWSLPGQERSSPILHGHRRQIPVPEPLVWDRNILVMSFLGEGECPYPQLEECRDRPSCQSL